MDKVAKDIFLSKIRDAVIFDRDHLVAIGEIKEFVVKHNITLASFLAMNGLIKTHIIYAICTPDEILRSSKDSEEKKRMMVRVRVSFKRLKDCLFPTSSVVQPEVELSVTNTGSSPTTMGAAQVAKKVTSSATSAGDDSEEVLILILIIIIIIILILLILLLFLFLFLILHTISSKKPGWGQGVCTKIIK